MDLWAEAAPCLKDALFLPSCTRGDATAKETQVRESPCLKIALLYAKQGWLVFPLFRPIEGRCPCRNPECANIGKHPSTKRGFLDATTDENQIREWWEFAYTIANIGIRTGQESGLVVLDVDPRHGGDETLRQLEAQHGPLPATPTVRSGGGGRHHYFRHPGSRVRTTSGILGSGFDTRGDGGYIIAPGSLHVSGQYYEFEDGKTPGDIPIAPIPTWLLAVLEEAYTQNVSAWVGAGVVTTSLFQGGRGTTPFSSCAARCEGRASRRRRLRLPSWPPMTSVVYLPSRRSPADCAEHCPIPGTPEYRGTCPSTVRTGTGE
jgi:hypothetical protein